jgi:DNA-binding MarR family transcriptional regulator
MQTEAQSHTNETREEIILSHFHHIYCFMERMRRRKPDWNRSRSRILGSLRRFGELSQKELAELLFLRSASLSEALDKIEGDGYVRRQRDERDRRVYNVGLTEKGRSIFERDMQDRREAMKKWFAPLNGEEIDQLSALLQKLVAAWRLELDEEERGGDQREREEGGAAREESGDQSDRNDREERNENRRERGDQSDRGGFGGRGGGHNGFADRFRGRFPFGRRGDPSGKPKG